MGNASLCLFYGLYRLRLVGRDALCIPAGTVLCMAVCGDCCILTGSCVYRVPYEETECAVSFLCRRNLPVVFTRVGFHGVLPWRRGRKNRRVGGGSDESSSFISVGICAPGRQRKACGGGSDGGAIYRSGMRRLFPVYVCLVAAVFCRCYVLCFLRAGTDRTGFFICPSGGEDCSSSGRSACCRRGMCICCDHWDINVCGEVAG